jgi:hypothetical protein
VSFAAIIFCVASQRAFIVISVYFVIDSVRKLLETLHICRFTAQIQNGKQPRMFYMNVRLLKDCLSVCLSVTYR